MNNNRQTREVVVLAANRMIGDSQGWFCYNGGNTKRSLWPGVHLMVTSSRVAALSSGEARTNL